MKRTIDPHIGSNFKDFLKEEGIFAEVDASSSKRVLAYQLQQAMESAHYSKTAMATRMNTSRAAVNRLLDPTNTAVTLRSMELAAVAVGKRLRITLEDDLDDDRTYAPASDESTRTCSIIITPQDEQEG